MDIRVIVTYSLIAAVCILVYASLTYLVAVALTKGERICPMDYLKGAAIIIALLALSGAITIMVSNVT